MHESLHGVEQDLSPEQHPSLLVQQDGVKQHREKQPLLEKHVGEQSPRQHPSLPEQHDEGAQELPPRQHPSLIEKHDGVQQQLSFEQNIYEKLEK